MPATTKETYPQRWRVFWVRVALVAMVAVVSALTLRITDPDKLIPLALSTVLYGAIVGILFKAAATTLWRRRRRDAEEVGVRRRSAMADDHQM